MDIDLTQYSMLLVNFSGGKDSSNILIETVKEARRQNVLHRVVAILSDTGAEWNSTADFSRSFCQRLGVPLQIVYPRCTIPDYLEARKRFPSMKCRWCTALKTSAIEKFIRHQYPAKQKSKILSITGERREESSHRAQLSEFELHKHLSAGQRQVFCYRPILNWNLRKVWQNIYENNLPIHPAYTEYGNKRLSCALCVFACDKDLQNGAKNRPDLAERYMRIEEETGFTFRYKHSLKNILKEGGKHYVDK